MQDTLLGPDELQLRRGIKWTPVPARLKSMVDALVLESQRTEEGYVRQIPILGDLNDTGFAARRVLV